MHNLRKFLLPLSLFIGIQIYGQSSVGKEFHIDKGLPSNTVRTICLDEKGSVYIGTSSGIQISPNYTSKNERISKIVGRANVWSIIQYGQWLYVGTFDSGLYIFNRESGNLYRRYSEKEIPCIRRIRILQNKIIGIYKDGVFELRDLNLYKSFNSPIINGKSILPIDVFTWKKRICVAHYGHQKQIYIWENNNKWTQTSENFLPKIITHSNTNNLVYLEVKNQLFIGNDKNGFAVVSENNNVQQYTFKLKIPKQWLQTLDLATDGQIVYIGVGNRLNFNSGFIWKHKINSELLKSSNTEIYIQPDAFIHFPNCITLDLKNDGVWYGSLLDGAYLLKNYKYWITAPSDYSGLIKIKNFIFTWSKTKIFVYSELFEKWRTIVSRGNVKNIIEINNQVFIQTDVGIFALNLIEYKLEQIYSGNTEHFFQLNGIIYWSEYFGGFQGWNPLTQKFTFKDFDALNSIVSLTSNGDFAVALSSNHQVYLLTNKKASLVSGIIPNNLSNIRIHFYGNMLVIQESKKLSFYSFDEKNTRVSLQNTIDLDKISLEPIFWISTNHHGLWLGLNNTLMQLGVKKQFPQINLISEYYLGQNIQNSVYEAKNVMCLTDEGCYRKSGNFIEIHPIDPQKSLGNQSTWETEFNNFKIFKNDILPSIREGQNFKIKFNSPDYLFQDNGYFFTVIWIHDTIQSYRLHPTSKDFWINDLTQGEYQIAIVTTGKKMALPLIVSRKLFLNNLFWLLLISIVLMGIYIIYLSQQEKYSLQQRLIGLELATLKSNLNPHFIFNMMNLIQSLIVRSEQKRALKAIGELAKINRLFLETSNKELISLAEEIDFAKKYIALEQMRFEDDKQFSFKINIESNIETKSWLIPPLIVQPLLENSLKHGVLLTKNNPLMGITISLTNPYTLNILIFNTLPENKHRKSTGTNMGIHLVSERLKWVNEKYNEIQIMRMDVLPKMSNEFQVLLTISKNDVSWLENL